jgi:hypothetical protein
MDPRHGKAHLRLWAGLTVLAPSGSVAAPASLLAFCAWQAGDGALANAALDRALADSPRYPMAQRLREALDSGAPPSTARLPMTPEEAAAAYGYSTGPRAGEPPAPAAEPPAARPPPGNQADTTTRTRACPPAPRAGSPPPGPQPPSAIRKTPAPHSSKTPRPPRAPPGVEADLTGARRRIPPRPAR